MSRRATLTITLAATLVAGCGAGQEGVDSQGVDSAGASDAAQARAAGGAATPVLCSGSPETISGVVVSVGGGVGLTINTGTTSETVYGLGPSWYWSQNGVARPVVGDSVVVVVSHLITTDERVILSITVDGQPLALRDPSTCAPLW
jgi:hypothetical protein